VSQSWTAESYREGESEREEVGGEEERRRDKSGGGTHTGINGRPGAKSVLIQSVIGLRLSKREKRKGEGRKGKDRRRREKGSCTLKRRRGQTRVATTTTKEPLSDCELSCLP